MAHKDNLLPSINRSTLEYNSVDSRQSGKLGQIPVAWAQGTNAMDPNQLQYVLEELSFFSEMPRDVLGPLAAESTIQEIPAGSVIFREGGTNQCLFLVRTGRVALEMKVPGRGSVRILTLGPGEMVGWSSLLDSGKMTATAMAIDDVQCVVAHADKLRELCRVDHEFGFHLMQQMASALAKRLVATRLQLLDLFADDPRTPPDHTLEGN